MQIKELYIENFGKLSAFRLKLSSGLNAFNHENGYGKTTLTVFIKSMLYGLDDTKKHNLSENDRKKYIPWQGGAFGGWLIFSVNGKSYRVERSFGAKASDDTFSLYNLDTGMLSDDFPEVLGEALFGIDADGFERTVFLSEKKLSGKNENQTISAKLSDLVGVDGDIGDFDTAIALLEKRRKFYQKKGGSGEIREIRTRLSLAEDELRAIAMKEELLAQKEHELDELTEKIRLLKKKKATLLERQQEDIICRERQSIEARYSDMLAALSEDEEKEASLLRFFEKKIPTSAEIYEISELMIEERKLQNMLVQLDTNSEYSEICNFFAQGTSYDECDRMVRLAEEAEVSQATLRTSFESDFSKSPFRQVPTEDEINSATESLSEARAAKKASEASVMLLAVGAILSVTGASLGALVEPAIFTLLGIGAAVMMLAVAVFFKSRGKTKFNVWDFISRIYGDDAEFDSELSALMTMRADLERYNAGKTATERLRTERELTEKRNAEAVSELIAFFKKFPLHVTSYPEAAKIVRQKFHRFKFLEETEGVNAKRRAEHVERLEMLCRRIADFISLFPTETENPIDEIRNRLAEYEVLRVSLAHRRIEAQKFALSHAITCEEPKRPLPSDAEQTSAALSEIDEELIALERQKSKLDAECNELSRDIEKRFEREAEIRELYETAELYEGNLNVIRKAKELLTKAKTNMTSRYLDGTTRGFTKYISLIESELGDFTLDTSFTVTKTDLGASRQSDSYSRGTRELYALAVRLSLIDVLYGENKPPLILDDPFISFDDNHTKRAVSVLKKLSTDRQILYFTCSSSREIH